MFNINMEEASCFFSIVIIRIKRLIGKIWYQYQGNPGASGTQERGNNHDLHPRHQEHVKSAAVSSGLTL